MSSSPRTRRKRSSSAWRSGPRTPVFDPTLGHDVPKGGRGTPKHRLVALGDSLTQGFQSGAIYNTDLSYPAIIARELGWFDSYRYPRYGGAGGLPLNLEYILRDLEHRYGADISPWELPLALFRARQVMDEIEDYWERGPGATAPVIAGYNHCLAVYGWDLRDALSRTAKSCETAIATPNDSLLDQIVENNGARAALRVYPALGRADALDDAARRRAGARRGPRRRRRPRDRDARGVPRREQRAAQRHRPGGQVERRRLQGPAQEGQVHGVAAVALHLRAGRARAGGRADRGAARDLVHGAARDDRADLPRRRPQGRAGLALLPVLHAPVDHRRSASIRAATRTSPTSRRAPSTTRSTCTTTRSRRSSSARGPAHRPATGTCSTSPACSTGWRRAATSSIPTRARRGGRRTRCPRR